MPDIRDVLKGLSPEFAAIYTEVRTTMRRAYLYAHSKTLPIEQYTEHDDQFLDLIDIKVAQLFDRSGSFDHSKGNLDTDKAKTIESGIQSQASKMLTNGWPVAK
jgi:hypothetical protein